MDNPLSPDQHRRLLRLWEVIGSERRTRLCWSWLVLARDDWSVTLEVARRWVVGRVRAASPLTGWFAGRLHPEDTPWRQP